MSSDFRGLAAYGWSPHFHARLDETELADFVPARVVAVHRGAIDVEGPAFTGRVPQLDADDPLDRATVGDFVLLDRSGRSRRVLERKSLFKRRAAGTGRELQLVAANVDTLLIVTSCNHDFNLARLERYLVLAREAGVTPLIVLTKADLADDPDELAAKARKLAPGLLVEPLDARDPAEVDRLRFWCGPGETVALLGSSGVGKSTLVNTLLAAEAQATGGIREGDSHGRHTTTGRSLLRLPAGGWLLDTPGMRELQLTDVGDGIDQVFDDVVRLAARCRFADCRHETEPGCAVQAAIAAGDLEPGRLKRYRKLEAEDRRNTETLAESRARFRRFGRLTRSALQDKRLRSGRDP
ncbi:MAG: ribosome small subunit-dependent GTPase A [Bauldia sp.]|nr:ribosome small subunit-dependent GTPase A [Bauldia sp.]